MIRQGRRVSLAIVGATLLAGSGLAWKFSEAAGFRNRFSGRSPETTKGASPASSGVAPAPPASREPGVRETTPQIARKDAPPPNGTEALLLLVDRAIEQNRRRYLNVTPGAQQNSPWQIMHGILAYRGDFQLKINQPGGPRKINAIQYISDNAVYRNENWFEATPYGGRAHPFNVPYWFEGHVNQFLAILTMSNLPLNHQFRVANGKVVTMADMVRHAQMTTSANVEPSWTLWFLTHYIDPDAEWKNMHGQKWSLAALAEIQTAGSVVDAPCGGTHGLFALAYARNSYLQKHGDLRGIWLSAHQKIEQYIQQAKNVQNQDGSFSTKFYRQREFSFDFAERIRASGHMLEWLMMGLPASRLNEPWVQAAVRSLATDLTTTTNQPIDPGPLYHACHALVLYRQRVQPHVPSPIVLPEQIATVPAPVPVQTAEKMPKSGKPISETKPIPPEALPVAPKPSTPIVKLAPAPVEPAPKRPVAMKPPEPIPAIEEPAPEIPPPPPLPSLWNSSPQASVDTPISVPVSPDAQVEGASAAVSDREDATAKPRGPLIAPPARLKLLPTSGRPMLVPVTPVPVVSPPAAIPLPDSIELPPQPPRVD